MTLHGEIPPTFHTGSSRVPNAQLGPLLTEPQGFVPPKLYKGFASTWLSPHPSAQITPAPEYTAGISPSSACSRTTVTLSSFEFLLVCTSYTVYNKVKPIAYGSAQADFPYKHGIRSSAKEVNNKYSHFFTIHILERSKRDSWYRCGARLGEDEEFGKAMGQQLLHAIPPSSQGKVELCTLR